ncbi:uncharacterized protein LOC141855351 [Brevipalpus obovatus]|uniref:uncharacterized protein LOC141855351 n=1 Tax=Brevipalpus obovatus TaxID=246614 RepID=UPI003D9E017F
MISKVCRMILLSTFFLACFLNLLGLCYTYGDANEALILTDFQNPLSELSTVILDSTDNHADFFLSPASITEYNRQHESGEEKKHQNHRDKGNSNVNSLHNNKDSWNEHLRTLRDGKHRSKASHVVDKHVRKENSDKKKSKERSKEGRDQAHWDNYGAKDEYTKDKGYYYEKKYSWVREHHKKESKGESKGSSSDDENKTMAKEYNDNHEKDIKSEKHSDESNADKFNNHSYLKLIKNLGSRYAVGNDRESEKQEDKQQNDYHSHRKRRKLVGIEY